MYRALPHAGGREACMRQPELAGKGQSQPRRLASSTKLWAGSQLLTTSSWNLGWLTSARRDAVWDQLPRDTRHTWDSVLATSQETERPGLGRWLRHTIHLGQCAHQAPGRLSWEGHETHSPPSLCPWGAPEKLNLSTVDPGSAQNTGPAWDSTPAEQPATWAV